MTVMRAVGDSAFLLVVVAAAALAVGSGSRQRVGDIVERFPLGTIGCMVADNLCRADETCTDDHLFGVCLSVGTQTKDVNYNFNKLLLEKLEREIWMLIFAGYSWQDAYTQCTLQNLLVTHQQQAPFDRITCLHLSASWPLGDHSSSPQELLIKGRLPKSEDSFSIDTSKLYNLPNSRKRDEFVNIHKYFDKPAVPSRRNGGIASDMMPPMETYLNSGYQEEKRSDQQPQLSAGINHEDLKEMKKYLMMLEDFMDAEDAEDRALGSDSSLPKGESKEVAYNDRFQSSPLSDKTGQGGAGDNPPDFDVLASSDKGLEASLQQPDGMNSENEENMPDLTPYELQLLEKLQEVPPTEKSALSQKEQDDFKYSEKLDDGGISNETEEKSTVDSLLQDISDTSREKDTSNNKGKSSYEEVATDYAFVVLSKSLENPDKGTEFVRELEKMIKLPLRTLTDVEVQNQQITFRINPNPALMNASEIANQAEAHKSQLEAATGLQLISAGIGNEIKVVESRNKPPKYFVLTFVLCGCIAGVLLAVVVIYLIKRHSHSKQKLSQLATTASEPSEACKDYQDLCRQRMQSKSSEKPEPLHAASRIGSVSEAQVRSPSSRSSTSSWSEEPVSSNMDISTGHIVLSYMEDHLKNKDRLDQEWEALCAYEADPSGTTIALDSSNARKNRYSDILPYDHSRVILNETANASTSDYVNANTITDHDPRNPAYIATQGPLPHTVADFWQMVWEQGSVVIVMLTKLTENGEAMCHRYWPEEGSDLYHIYEVHLVSEHIWCDDYLVRSFYLKNLQTNETRTVTQFHFLSWMDLDVPSSIKALLDFRRKVNKSYRGRSCPIVVHCSDGCGRTGTYCLTDMVLNRMAKGAKEIDIAATLEHIRDQRMTMVKTKEQFQYALAAVAEEVNAILKALPQ